MRRIDSGNAAASLFLANISPKVAYAGGSLSKRASTIDMGRQTTGRRIMKLSRCP